MNYNPYPATYMPNYQQPVNNSSNMVWVQGESGAKAYPIAPGTSQVLFDSEAQIFYIKSADQSGMPQPLRIFNYSECNEADIKHNDIDTSMFITYPEAKYQDGTLIKQGKTDYSITFHVEAENIQSTTNKIVIHWNAGRIRIW